MERDHGQRSQAQIRRLRLPAAAPRHGEEYLAGQAGVRVQIRFMRSPTPASTRAHLRTHVAGRFSRRRLPRSAEFVTTTGHALAGQADLPGCPRARHPIDLLDGYHPPSRGRAAHEPTTWQPAHTAFAAATCRSYAGPASAAGKKCRGSCPGTRRTAANRAVRRSCSCCSSSGLREEAERACRPGSGRRALAPPPQRAARTAAEARRQGRPEAVGAADAQHP